MALSTPVHGERRDPPRQDSSTVAFHPTNGTSRVDEPVGSSSAPELVGRLINDVSKLVDKQIELAKQEIRESIGEAAGAVKQLVIGAGVAAAAGLLLVITAWTAFIWFFNWLGALVLGLTGVGWLAAIGGILGWLLGFVIPAAVAYFVGWKRFLKRGIDEGKGLTRNPMGRTRATLKEDLEWFRQLRTPSAR